MKAAVLHANEDMRYEDYPAPDLAPGTVKVRVRATGICGSDVPRVLHNGAHFYPVVLGHEFAGDVVEAAPDVRTLAVGDTVSGAPLKPCLTCEDCQQGNYALCKNYSFIGSREQGSFAQYVVMPARNAVKYDPAVPYEHAAMFEPATVAIHGVRLNGLNGGDTVAVLGCGTIGVFTIQWARIFGARRVVAFDIDARRLALAREMGADETVNTREAGFVQRALACTGGKGFQSVFETAGSPATMDMAFTLAGNKARVCFIGTPHQNIAFTPKQWENINRKEFALTGSWMSYSAPFPGAEWGLTAHCCATGALRFADEMIFRRYPLAQAADAFALYRNPSQVHGKIMLMVE
jgi:L-iditol 2-dehydrogenase